MRNKINQVANWNDIADALFDAYDIKNALTYHQLLHLLKDNDGTEFTIGDCIDNIIHVLEGLDKLKEEE